MLSRHSRLSRRARRRFCFGEKWVHESILLPKPIRTFLYRRFRLAGQLLRGRFYVTFLGHVTKRDGSPLRLGFVWGTPIRVAQQEAPSDAYVAEVHAAYVTAVQQLFERHKASFGYAPEETLVIVSAKSTKAA